MYNSKGPTGKAKFNSPKIKSKGFKKESAPYTKNDKMDKLKKTKVK